MDTPEASDPHLKVEFSIVTVSSLRWEIEILIEKEAGSLASQLHLACQYGVVQCGGNTYISIYQKIESVIRGLMKMRRKNLQYTGAGIETALVALA